MKKIILVLVAFLMIGCQHNSVYDDYVAKIESMNTVSENLPFKVNVYVDNVNSERIIYQVVIDEAMEPLKDVKVFVIHNSDKETFPSIGILDDPISLDEKTKGINLVGYANKKETIEFKIYMEVENQEYLTIYNYR